MLIKDTLAGGAIVDQMLENSLQKIGVLAYSNVVVTDAMLAACTIAVTRGSKSGAAIPVMFPMSLQAALEIAAANEGHYKSSDLAGLSLYGTIDISAYGTLLLKDEYLTISLSHTNGANFGVKLFALDGNSFTTKSIDYLPNIVLADTPKLFSVGDCNKIALPVVGLQKLILNYADGRTATYQADEIAMLCADTNDVVSILSTGAVWVITTGFKNFFVLPIVNVVSCTVHYTAQTKFFTVRNN